MNIRANRLHVLGSLVLGAALAGAGCASTAPSGYGYGGPAPSGSACYDCGTVTRIETGTGSRMPNATGAIIGGVLGAAAGREVAKDHTDSKGRQNTATVAGAALPPGAKSPRTIPTARAGRTPPPWPALLPVR